MATAATTNDEELLIITDDGDSGEDILDFKIEQDESTTSDDLISFGESKDNGVEESYDDIFNIGGNDEEGSREIGKESDINLDFDFGSDHEDLTVEKMLGDKEESVEDKLGTLANNSDAGDDDFFDLGFADEESRETDNKNIVEEKPKVSENDGDFEINFGENDVPDSDSLSVIDTEQELPNLDDAEVELTLDDVEINLENDDAEVELTLDDVGGNGEENISFDMEENVEKKVEGNVVDLGGFDLDEEVVTTGAAIAAGTIAKNVLKDDSDSTTGGDDDDDDDVNAILDETIARLIKRKDQIEQVKEETISQIAALNDEIKALQADVKDKKSEVKEFDAETSKIQENITGLEKMKMPEKKQHKK